MPGAPPAGEAGSGAGCAAPVSETLSWTAERPRGWSLAVAGFVVVGGFRSAAGATGGVEPFSVTSAGRSSGGR